MQSAFDEDLDESPQEYAVYIVPESASDSRPVCSPEFLSSTQMACIGRIPINQVRFDPSKRKELDASILDDFLVGKERTVPGLSGEPA